MADNRVIFGLKNVHVAVWDSDTESYGTPVAVPGAVSLSISTEGSSDKFYADDIIYATLNTNSGYTGDLEFATLEDEIRQLLLSETLDSNGMLIENANVSEMPSFALLYEVESNIKPQRFCFYNCTADRPGSDANTKTDTTDPDTATLPISMSSRELATESGTLDVVKSSIVYDSSSETVAATYDAWYTQVTLPTVSA